MKHLFIYLLSFFLFSCQENKENFFSKDTIPKQTRFLMLDNRNIDELKMHGGGDDDDAAKKKKKKNIFVVVVVSCYSI